MDYKPIALTKSVHNCAYDAILPTRPEISQAGKTVLITAGTAGIAYAIARNFGIAGAAKVIITGRSEERLQSAVKNLTDELLVLDPQSETKYDGRLCQVADPCSIDALFDSLRKENTTVDVLVLSAAQIGPGKIKDQTWEDVWEQFVVNVRSLHQFIDLFEKQPRVRAGPRYILNVSTAAIHHYTLGVDLGSYTLTKNSGSLLLQKIADETDPSETQIINFHPGLVLGVRAQGSGMDAKFLNWDHEDLPGSFAVWAASPEAAFLHGRFVWAAWDVEELKNGPLREKLENEANFLKVSVNGL